MIDLDSPCGATFTYRDLVECSNTYALARAANEQLNNEPRELETFAALQALAHEILDPVAMHFLRPVITYGFAGPALTRRIKSRIAPHLDQHASHERRDNEHVCARLGAAVDFHVPGFAAAEVARWIFANRAFDRIYLYGDDRPLHVSVGPDNARAVVELRPGPSGRQIPRKLRW